MCKVALYKQTAGNRPNREKSTAVKAGLEATPQRKEGEGGRKGEGKGNRQTVCVSL